MWKLYDDLYIGIPSGIRIAGCVVGEKWTTVKANGNIGIASTLELPEDPEEFAASFTGAYLRDTANYMKWDNLAIASVGVAAMNAWYNTKERAEGFRDLSSQSGDLPGKTAYVGSSRGKDTFPLPMEPDFDENIYIELCEYDSVGIASEAVVTRALPGILKLSGDAKVILEGYSLPCTALFFAFGMPVRELRGYCAAKDMTNPADGALPFVIRPITVERVHE